MSRSIRQLRQNILIALLLFVAGMLAVTGYTLWRVRADAVLNGFEMAAMHSQDFEDFLTQSLHVTQLVAANVLPPAGHPPDLRQIESAFVTTLSRAPYLRSMSLLDEQNLIVASSNPANVGLTVPMQDYLPALTADAQEVLRIGQPWAGRDISGGRPSTAGAAVEVNAPGFIPITHTLMLDGRRATLLVALNPDYFINHMERILDAGEGSVEVLRYDGTRLMSTDPEQQPGSLRDVGELRLSEVESGQFEQDSARGRPMLIAFRASPLYPLILLTHLDRDYALRHWRTEARALLSVVLMVLLAISLLSWAFYRRQRQLIDHRADYRRLQRINATVFASSTEAILIADNRARIVSTNHSFSRVTGHRAEDLIGRHLFELLTDEGIDAFTENMGRLGQANGAPGDAASFEVQQRCTDEQLIWTEIRFTPDHDATGEITGYHCICRNITERKAMEAEVRQLAFHDPLTQLPNRRLLNDRLSQAMAASKRNACHGALLFLDLDNFKSLNDLHGHEVGDLLLVEAAHRLKSNVREIDTVARFGGDEFVVMLSVLNQDHAVSLTQAAAIGEKIRHALSLPYRLMIGADGLAGIEHRCSASIGIALFQDTRQEDILRWADAAMYRAKETGNRIHFHDLVPV